MRIGKLWFVFGCFIASAFVLCSCGGVSLRYSSSGIDAADFGPRPMRMEAVDLIDSRPYSTTPIVRKNPADDIKDLRESVREHLKKAGIVPSQGDVVAVPASVEQVEAILSAARKQGADAVLFLRLDNVLIHGRQSSLVTVINAINSTPLVVVGILPLFVVYSIPLNGECAHAVVEAVVIDPKTRVLLGRFVEREDYDDTVSSWSYSPPDAFAGVMKRAVQKAVVAVAGSAKAGFPGRTSKADLKAILAPAEAIQFHPIAGSAKTAEMRKGQE